MTIPPTGWYELTRTRHTTGRAPFEFVDGPASGQHLLDVGDVKVPAQYAVLGHIVRDEEVVYIRKGSLDRFYFEYVRPVLNLAEHITCPRCGRTSAHPRHIADGWCPPCMNYTQFGAEEPVHSGAETVEHS